jgi:tetratricopeptide (TPR) repeat protein
MRLAQYLDDPNRPPEKWDIPHELTDAEGDKPYLEVLDRFYDDPFAQEARLGLFWRFRSRGDIDNMLDYGKNYLRLARADGEVEDKQTLGKVFLALAETLLEKQKYQEIYDIYYSEYEFIKDYPDGRLLYLVGQAMDALSLYDQAAVIYYRALKWPLPEADKINLYYKRANVYLLKGDLEAAERLLKYLLEIYQGEKEIGEVYSLSGRLREAQKREREALEFYRKAVEVMTSSDKKSEYATDAVRLALLLDGSAAVPGIKGYLTSGYLSGPALQKMYASAGDVLRLAGEDQKAASMYMAALAEGLPQEGKVFQEVQLYLGDSLLALQKNEEAVEHYQKAVQGGDSLLRKMAQERLNQNAIEMELSRLKNGEGS